jgi:predicted RNase H-like HicB family nuclease
MESSLILIDTRRPPPLHQGEPMDQEPSMPLGHGYAESMPELPHTLTAALHQEGDWYIAQCLEVDVASQGHTIDEALANLAEAVELYLEEVDDPAGHVTATPLVTSFQLPAA